MRIELSPVVVLPEDSTDMDVMVSGDSIAVSGVMYDFSQLPEGGYLPASAIHEGPFSGRVTRADLPGTDPRQPQPDGRTLAGHPLPRDARASLIAREEPGTASLAPPAAVSAQGG